MSKERYNQIVDEVYKNYLNETMFSSDPTWLEPIPVMDMKTGEKSMGARQYHKEAFLNKCKTNKEFSERWGLKIEERTVFEQVDQNNPVLKGSTALYSQKLITVTYNNETIEIYE
jgi:hypothetical protein